MRFYSVTGKLVYKNLNKYRVKWDKPSKSKVQFNTKQFLKKYWNLDILYEESPVYGTRLSVDFLNVSRMIAIEVDGSFHEKYNPFFHNNSRLNYLSSIKRDMQKEKWLEKNGFAIVRIKETEVKDLSVKFFEEKFGIRIV